MCDLYQDIVLMCDDDESCVRYDSVAEYTECEVTLNYP